VLYEPLTRRLREADVVDETGRSEHLIRCACEAPSTTKEELVMFLVGFIFPILWIVGAVWERPQRYQPGSRP
jgi:hypothetical protein